MRKLIFFWCLLLLAACLHAQTLTLTSAGAVYPGSTLTVTATLAGSSGQNISGLGFGLPTGSATPALGVASTAASKTLWSNGLNSLLVGFTNPAPPAQPVASNVVYADGPALTFTYLVPSGSAVGSTVTLALSAPLGASNAGASVPITSDPLTLTVGTNPACLSAVQANITAYFAAPSLAALDKILTELAAASTSGSCQ